MIEKNQIAAALAGALTLTLAAQASAQTAPTPAPVPAYSNEKCYGIAKAGKNDCQTATGSCAGTAKADAQGDAWVYTPKGSCTKIVGASLSPKAKGSR